MTFRARLFFSYATLVLVCLVVITGAAALIVRGYLDNFSKSRITDVARPIYVQSQTLAATETTFERVWSILQEQADVNELYLLLVDQKGNIVRSATPSNESVILEVAPGVLPAGIKKVENGIFQTESGQSFVYSAYPIGRNLATLTAASTADMARTLIIAVPRSQLIGILTTMTRPLLFSVFIALVISLIFAYVMARSVYRPLKHLSQATENMAQGKYDQEIPLEGPKEFKKLAENFNYMTKQIQQAQERLRHFVADVSHQLKSPLTSIQGFALAITDGTASDKSDTEKAAAIIQEETRKMRRQVDELLELSRMQSGQTRMKQEPVDIAELVNECRDIFSLRLEEKQLELSISLSDVRSITGDYDRLEQAISNLLDNAIKNTPQEGKIRVSAETKGEILEIKVSDNGPGIPPEQIPYVFERFYQAMGVRTGVGLGLAIVKEIIIAHGGTIEAASAPGEGAEFTIRLPFS